YISLFIIVIVALFITPIIETFASDSEPDYIPIGSQFMSSLIGNDFTIIASDFDESINFDFSDVEDFDFLYNFTSNYPN
ncbi:MAG: hypothetical protein R6V04_13350, partial [bacterium]